MSLPGSRIRLLWREMCIRDRYTHGFQKYINYSGWGADREDGKSHKAENMNDVAIPELKRLAAEDQPFFLFLRHMDPHSPYLPPAPFDRMFHSGDECDPDNHSLDELYAFEPFRDYFREWFPAGCTDKEYINAQYDGAIAYMDSCIQRIFTTVRELGIENDTLIVLTSDHGETLDEHSCYYDHHGLYEGTLHVPLVFKLPGVVPDGYVFDDYVQQKDVMPTILEILGIKTKLKFDGRSLVPLWTDGEREAEPEMYLTEATWMRKDVYKRQVLFHRKIQCGYCRLAMTRKVSKNPYYVCETYKDNPESSCPDERIYESEIAEIVLAAIRKQAQLFHKTKAEMQKKQDKTAKRTHTLQEKISDLQSVIGMKSQEKMQAFEDMVSGRITQKAYQAKCERCDAYIRTTEAKISALEERRKKEEIVRSPEADAFLPHTNLRTLTREIADALIYKIYVYSGQAIEIV